MDRMFLPAGTSLAAPRLLSISAILISASGLATAQSASPSGRFLDEVEEEARNKSTLPGDHAVEEERLETIFVTNPARADQFKLLL
ncbi:MAG: hypothetical protein NTV93_19665 [Verrucomicrobia bacterium]|nr:hypothetical protein [Verrucomicrobiota bacterium]